MFQISAQIVCVAMCGLAVPELRGQEAVPPAPGQGAVSPAGVFTPAEPAPSAGKPVPADLATLAKESAGLVQKEGEGVFRIGRVTFDTQSRSMAIPATVQIRENTLLEYALVTRTGKAHEALFTTDASPLHIHLAALMLKLAPDSKDKPPGKVAVEVSWQTNGPERREPLESLIVLAKHSPAGAIGETLKVGEWEYSGSSIERGTFVAEREGSLIALVSDPQALVENPRPGHEDDTLFLPNIKLLPGKGVPVTIHLRMAQAAKPSP